MAENWIQGMNRCTGPVPCTVCGVSPYKHGSYPTCASHPYTADGKCQHVGALVGSVFTGAPCAGAECKNGCVRAARGVNAPVEPDKRKPWEKSSWTCALATVNNTGMHCPPPGQRCPDCPTGVPPTRRFTGVGHLEETGYIPAGSAAEREGKDGVPPTRRFTGDGAERRVEAKAAGLRWCRHCGEGVTDFCRGKTDACPKGLPATGVNAPDRAALIAAADKHADNYEGHDIPANETRAAIRNAFVAGSQFAAGVPVDVVPQGYKAVPLKQLANIAGWLDAEWREEDLPRMLARVRIEFAKLRGAAGVKGTDLWNGEKPLALQIADEALARGVAPTVEVPPLDPAMREFMGKLVRAEWERWAREQPNPKPSWLTPWDQLTEPEREVDRRIAEAIWRFSYVRDAAGVNAPVKAEFVTASVKRFKVGDTVRLTLARDPRTATVRGESGGGVQLDTSLGGYYNWNEFDLEHVSGVRAVDGSKPE
jgi:hypothetical protein